MTVKIDRKNTIKRGVGVGEIIAEKKIGVFGIGNIPRSYALYGE